VGLQGADLRDFSAANLVEPVDGVDGPGADEDGREAALPTYDKKQVYLGMGRPILWIAANHAHQMPRCCRASIAAKDNRPKPGFRA
jgi:hypothetical protein